MAFLSFLRAGRHHDPGARPAVTLGVEELESRCLPAGIDPATGFVTGLYLNVLLRQPDPGGLNSWVGQLRGGASRADVARAFWNSAERHTLLVEGVYNTYLQRDPDPAGLAGWLGALRAGLDDIGLLQAFVGSAEYQALHPTDDAFLRALYLDLLGRDPDPAGQASWLATLQTGVGRPAVAAAFVRSPEFAALAVQAQYVNLLGREGSPTEVVAYLAALPSNPGGLGSLPVGFLASEEFFVLARQEALANASLDTRSPAVIDLGTLGDNPLLATGAVTADAPFVVYRFTVTVPQLNQVLLTDLTGDAQVELAADLDGEGRLDGDDFLDGTALAGTETRSLEGFLQPGTYYLRVDHGTGDAAYTLIVANTATASARQLGQLSNNTLLGDGRLTATARSADFVFTVAAAQSATVTLSDFRKDIDAALLAGTGPEALPIAVDTEPGTANKVFAADLAPGTYTVRVTDSASLKDRERTSVFVTVSGLAVGTTPPAPFFGNLRFGFGLARADRALGALLGRALPAVTLPGANDATNNINDLNLLGAGGAWQAGYTGTGVTVAVIDTGVNLEHPKLRHRLFVNPHEIPANGIDDDRNGFIDDYHGYNFAADNGNLVDTSGHGTGVAGVIAAERTERLSGVTGVAYDARLLILQAFADGHRTTTDTFTRAIQYAVDHGAQVINISSGDQSLNLTRLRQKEVIRQAIARGVIFVAAAGNTGSPGPAGYPAAFATDTDLLPVGAIDRQRKVAAFSSGANFIPSLRQFVVAPGVAIRLLDKEGSGAGQARNGTSFAAPYVAGVAALLVQANNQRPPEQRLTVSQLVRLLGQTADTNLTT